MHCYPGIFKIFRENKNIYKRYSINKGDTITIYGKMRLKIRLEEGGFLPLMVLLAVIFLSLAFIFGLFGLFSDRVTAIIIDGDGEVCGPGLFRCGPVNNGVCCQSGSERCVSGECVAIDATPNGTFFDVQNAAYCSISTPGVGYCGGSCKKTIQIVPDACTKKITLTSVTFNDEGETAANGTVLVKDYSCTCRAGSAPSPLGSCAIYPNGPDGNCGGGTNCGSESGDGFGGGQCTGTRTYNINVPFTRGIPVSAYIYAIDDCRSKGAGLWGEGRAIYTENRLRCDTGYKCDASTGSPRCVLLCGDGFCDASEDITSCPQDCTPPQICGNGLVETGEQCDDGNTDSGDGCSSTCQIESPNNPKGSFDSLYYVPGELCDTSSRAPLDGWACDADNYSQTLNVELYADGQRGSGVLIGTVRANRTREQAVGNECGGIRNHGFVFKLESIPEDFKDGANHQIYAYGINIGSGNDTLLKNSPITINCEPPPPPPLSCVLNSASWSVNQTVEGQIVDLRVTTIDCQGQELFFKVKENDVPPLPDTPANINPANVFVAVGGTAISVSNWTAEWIDDGLFQGNPEYYFTATLVSTGQNIQSSNELQVYQQAPLLCEGVVTCSNYLNQQDCENDICIVANNSVPVSVDCSDPDTDCSCLWNTTKNSCEGSWKRTSKGSDIGTCQYTENTADTCEDDGYLTVDLTARWIWDSGCDNTCRADNQEAASKCQSTTEIFQCPAQIPLPFFGFYNALASIVLIAVIYWTISLRKRGKRK